MMEEEFPEESKQPTKNLNIFITGTPGTGKTTLSRLVAEELKLNYINLGEIVINQKIYDTINEEFNVPEFNEEKLLAYILPALQQGGNVIDFHSSFFLPIEYFQLIVLLRCNNTELYDRLHARGYNQRKIDENIECEILEATADEVKETFGEKNVQEFKSETIEDMQKNFQFIVKWVTEWKAKGTNF